MEPIPCFFWDLSGSSQWLTPLGRELMRGIWGKARTNLEQGIPASASGWTQILEVWQRDSSENGFEVGLTGILEQEYWLSLGRDKFGILQSVMAGSFYVNIDMVGICVGANPTQNVGTGGENVGNPWDSFLPGIVPGILESFRQSFLPSFLPMSKIPELGLGGNYLKIRLTRKRRRFLSRRSGIPSSGKRAWIRAVNISQGFFILQNPLNFPAPLFPQNPHGFPP